jgi:peptidoglycan/LPS O-acetylase OafA/YrhL
MMNAARYALLAAVGVGVGLLITIVHQHYFPGDALYGGRMLFVWLAVVLWVAACLAGALGEFDKRRQQ